MASRPQVRAAVVAAQVAPQEGEKRAARKDLFLTGGWEPVDTEYNTPTQIVTGEIPQWLAGIYARNGPNPHYPDSLRGRPYHTFDGDGMVHAMVLGGGKAQYVNRWVRTERFKIDEPKQRNSAEIAEV